MLPPMGHRAYSPSAQHRISGVVMSEKGETPKVRHKHIGPRAEKPIWVAVTAEERAQIQKTARAVRLPLSAYMRNMALGYQPPSLLDQEAIIEAFRIRGDLGRMGGLFKLWLVDEPQKAVSKAEIRAVLDRTLELQNELTSLIDLMRKNVTVHRDR